MNPRLVACDRTYADSVLDILNDVIENSTALYDYHRRTPAMMQSWFDAKTAGRFPIIGVVDERNALLGFGSYGPFRSWPAYKYTVEHSIYVERSRRGRGIGALLLTEIITAARSQDYHTLIGGIDAQNEASIALHRRFGFELCGQIRQAGFKFNRWLDLQFYQLILDSPRQPVDG